MCPQDFGDTARKAALVATAAGAVNIALGLKALCWEEVKKTKDESKRLQKSGRAIEVDCHLLVLAQQWNTTINGRIGQRQRGPRPNMRMYWEQAMYLVMARRHVSDLRSDCHWLAERQRNGIDAGPPRGANCRES
jgi:hypothetical protein